jgi:Carboxypeptidase regulatory-like domain
VQIRMKAIGTTVVLALVLSLALKATSPQGKGESQLRTVNGSVIDHSENPVPSSVVYLKNLRSQAVKTYIADDSGHYRFSGLDPNVDYEVHAEKGDLTSSNRTVSSFDSRKDIEVILKLDKKKTSH